MKDLFELLRDEFFSRRLDKKDDPTLLDEFLETSREYLTDKNAAVGTTPQFPGTVTLLLQDSQVVPLVLVGANKQTIASDNESAAAIPVLDEQQGYTTKGKITPDVSVPVSDPTRHG